MSTVRERVERGAKLLDEHFPGWDRVVNSDELRMADFEHCVCGQVGKKYLKLGASCYVSVVKKLGMLGNLNTQIAHGFESCEGFLSLREEWRHLLRERKQANEDQAPASRV